MKTNLLKAFAVLALSALASANVMANPIKVTVDLNRVYAPLGFDSNDNAQVVVTGNYANSCYKNAETDVVVDHAKKQIFLKSKAYKYDGYCLQVILPFDRVVDLGILEEGEYTITDLGESEALGQLTVNFASQKEADDYLYAPVSQAYLETKSGVNTLFLNGEFPNSCMKIKEVRVNVQSEVLVVQPIIELQEKNCQTGSFSFETKTIVPDMPAGKYLLHVRSMNGKAINNLIDVR